VSFSLVRPGHIKRIPDFRCRQGIVRRGELVKAFSSHPDVPQLVDWIRMNAGTDWETYLNKVGPPASPTYRPAGGAPIVLGAS